MEPLKKINKYIITLNLHKAKLEQQHGKQQKKSRISLKEIFKITFNLFLK
jgi:hypothetical protein